MHTRTLNHFNKDRIDLPSLSFLIAFFVMSLPSSAILMFNNIGINQSLISKILLPRSVPIACWATNKGGMKLTQAWMSRST